MSHNTEDKQFIPVRIAVMTVSNTRQMADDVSGDTLSKRLIEAGHFLATRVLVRDNIRQIRLKARDLVKRDDVDVLITTGGTGLTGDDVTIEAIRGLLDKEADGFSVAFHMMSWGKIGTSTMQSRAIAGVSYGKYVFCLPGSPGACRDGWDELLKPQLDYRHKPCNFVEIMPRLDEHLKRKK